MKSVPQSSILKAEKLVFINDNCLFVALTSMEPLRMFTHFYAALLLTKTCFCKTRNIFFFSSTRRRLTKLLTVSESSIKLKFRSDLKLFVIFLISAVYLQTKTFWWKRNCAIPSKLNITLAKAVLEGPYKVLQGSWKGATFKRPVQFLKAVQF